jgi:hypothetical protein
MNNVNIEEQYRVMGAGFRPTAASCDAFLYQ